MGRQRQGDVRRPHPGRDAAGRLDRPSTTRRWTRSAPASCSGHITDASYFTGKDPAFALIGNPVGAYSSPEELRAFFNDGGGADLYNEILNPYGVQFVGAAAQTPESVPSKVPITSVEDLQGVKIRAPEGMVQAAFAAAGASPVNLPQSEVFTSLDKGVISAADATTLATNDSMGLHDVALPPDLSRLPLAAAERHLVNKAAWDGLPEDLKAIVNASVDTFILNHIYSVRKLDAEAVVKAKANPEIEIINWSGDERAKFRRIAQDEWKTWAAKTEMTQRYYYFVIKYLEGRNLL